MRTRCDRCHNANSIYNVISPLCLGSCIIALCPACFQEGIDEEEIHWLGNSPYGICSECESTEGVA